MDGLKQAQVILYVRDMGASLAFYRDVLGLEVTFPLESADLSQEYWVTLDAAGTSVALHPGRSVDLGGEAPGLSLVVDDLERVLAGVRSRGGEFGEVVNPHPGVVFSVGKDPDGHSVTLKQG